MFVGRLRRAILITIKHCNFVKIGDAHASANRIDFNVYLYYTHNSLQLYWNIGDERFWFCCSRIGGNGLNGYRVAVI